MAGASRRRGGGSADYTWPGYVDALTTLLMVLIFLLSLFSDRIGQFSIVLGVAGVGIAFALQEVIVSLAGWLALARNPRA